MTGFIKRAFHTYFGIKLGDQDKVWAPQWYVRHAPISCVVGPREIRVVGSLEFLRFGENRQAMSLTINVTGFRRKKQNCLMYHDLESARRPVAQCNEIPIPVSEELSDISDEDLSTVEKYEE